MVSTFEETLVHAMFLARHLNHCDLQYAVIAILLDLGVPTKPAGFDYLKWAIIEFFENPTQTITKELYPNVGKHYGRGAGYFQVEKAISRVIAEAWNNRDESVWRCYFPVREDGDIDRPSNAEFISRIARFVELWQGCCEEVEYERA